MDAQSLAPNAGMKLLIAITLAVVCVIVLSVIVLWDSAMNNQYPTLQTIPIDSTKDVERYELQFTNPVEGRYSISITTGGASPPIRYRYELGLDTTKVVLRSESGEYIKSEVSGDFPAFSPEDHRGLRILYYDVPDDLPRNKKITGYIKFSPGSYKYFAQYGFDSIIVKRVYKFSNSPTVGISGD